MEGWDDFIKSGCAREFRGARAIEDSGLVENIQIRDMALTMSRAHAA